jgi:hypothetical protein
MALIEGVGSEWVIGHGDDRRVTSRRFTVGIAKPVVVSTVPLRL